MGDHSNQSRQPAWAWGSLLLVGLIAGLLWRLEVEWHSWTGLIWITYFHWAIPAGAMLFLIWLGAFCGIHPTGKRALFLLIAALLALGSYFLAVWALTWRFRWVPEAYIAQMSWEEIRFRLRHMRVEWIPAIVIPQGACGLARIFGVRPGWVRWASCQALFLAAEPLAMLVLYAVEHVGGHDAIHAIKSGFIIPPLVFALGIPFLPRRKAAA